MDMMTRDGGCNREQIEFTSLEDLVPEDHLVRKLENALAAWNEKLAEL